MPGQLADIAGVPLFVKYPGQKQGRVDPRYAKTIDILPTIADVLGSPVTVAGGRAIAHRAAGHASGEGGSAFRIPMRASGAAVAADVCVSPVGTQHCSGSATSPSTEIGPRPDLLGRPVSTLSRTIAADANVVVDRAFDLAHVRKSSGYVPAQILGRISWTSLRHNDDLAIAVNGRVAATTRPYTYQGATEFSTMVDEDVLHDGRNDVDVFVVRGVGPQTRLVVLSGDDAARVRVAAGTG